MARYGCPIVALPAIGQQGPVNDRPVSPTRWHQSPRRWLVAIGVIALATGLRFLLDPLLPPGFPFLTYYPAVLIIAYLAGFEAGALGGLLAFAIAWYFFVPPRGSFALDAPTLLSLIAFLIADAIGLLIVDRLDGLARTLAAERDRSASLADEQARASVAVWGARQRLDILMQQVPVGIVEADLTGVLRFVNDRAATLFGRRVADLAGVSLLELVHIADRGDIMAAIDRQVGGERPESLALRPMGFGLPGLTLHLAVAHDPERRPQALLAAIEASR